MKIGFIGCGNMGGALASAALGDILLFDKNAQAAQKLAKLLGGKALDSAEAVAREADLLFLGVKPNVVPSVIEEIRASLDGEKCVLVSMAAGVSTASIDGFLAKKVPVIRIMPNTPAAIGEGMILVTGNDAVTEDMFSAFSEAMKNAGTISRIDERLIDAASAVSGCGPAFVYMFIEALADAGVKCGLPRDKALLFAEVTVKGAAALALQTKQNPAALKDAVCSPGGSTIEGVMSLEKGAFRGTVMNAVTASYEKTLKLGK